MYSPTTITIFNKGRTKDCVESYASALVLVVNAGSDVHFGLAAGYSFSRYDLVLSGGQIQDTSGEAGVLPIYATLGSFLSVRCFP